MCILKIYSIQFDMNNMVIDKECIYIPIINSELSCILTDIDNLYIDQINTKQNA